jgi:hypothetical protein
MAFRLQPDLGDGKRRHKTLRFRRAGKQIIAGGITLGTTQALALAAAGFDDNEPAEFVRERSLIIPIGEKKYVTVPMPLGFHVIPNIGRVRTAFALGGSGSQLTIQCDWRRCLRKRSVRWAVRLFIQTIAPTPPDPLVALSENKD